MTGPVPSRVRKMQRFSCQKSSVGIVEKEDIIPETAQSLSKKAEEEEAVVVAAAEAVLGVKGEEVKDKIEAVEDITERWIHASDHQARMTLE